MTLPVRRTVGAVAAVELAAALALEINRHFPVLQAPVATAGLARLDAPA